ncbi:glutathione S-transferase family protein [Paraburkholderia gardini]|uniref:glutathione S-transferase family protein n=1 Tax=Paraburkholderia gardini TaxID=2823469 RepID=UPI001DCBC278|nr:glutathione S-transferase [Paraburkholderia gardini]CAG4903337.1 Disulfide-bond oxidoreductase YfcG [Paraburkholderia gardini]
MKLYYHPLSGHAHRARLFLSLLGIEHELVEVDLTKREQKSPEFLKLNAFGQIPVLVDGDTVIPDSNSILVYLASRFGKTDWLPVEPRQAAAVQRWLSVAAGDLAFGPAAARLVTLFGAKLHADEVIARAHTLLARIETQLAGREWIALAHPSIADVALYSYVARAPEGNVDLSAYPNVMAWLARVEALPGFVPFAQSPAGLAGKAA